MRRCAVIFVAGIVAALAAAPAQATIIKNESIGVFHPDGGWRLINRLAEGTTTDFAFGFGTYGDVPVPGDWDGDGKDGVGIFRPGSGSWFLINRPPTSGAAPPSDIVVSNYGITGDRPVAGDFNGDGKDDIGVYRPSTTDWYLHLSPTNGESGPAANIVVGGYGIAEDIPVAGDWNGDGRDGIGLYRPSTGTWFLLNTAVNGAVNPPSDIVTHYGISSDLPVAGDWDGDGKDGIGVYRAALLDGSWFFTNTPTSDPPPGAVIFSYFGASNDTPVAGDWDGRRPECRDGRDNDYDGQVDYAGGDSGCKNAYDHPEDVVPGSVVWDADAEQATDQEWASSCTEDGDPNNGGNGVAPPAITSRIAQVNSPLAQGQRAYRLQVQDGDGCGNASAERAELSQGNPTRTGFLDRLFSEGEERWISWQVYLPNAFPSDATTWQVIAQWKQMGGLGTPVLSMEARNGQFRLYNSTTNDGTQNNTKVLYQTGVVKGRWVKFTLHVKFSPSASVGFVELYADTTTAGTLAPLLNVNGQVRTSTWTMKTSNGATVQSHSRIGIYRDAAINGTSEAYYDGYTVATSRPAAEEHAFRP
jgi:polysaccharide lyase-like protein